MMITAKIISAMARPIRILIVSLSVPKIMGIGPIIRIPPPFVFPFKEMFLISRRSTAAKVTMNPKIMKVSPNAANAP